MFVQNARTMGFYPQTAANWSARLGFVPPRKRPNVSPNCSRNTLHHAALSRMPSNRDDLKDSFYLHVIRKSVADALKARYDLTEPLPHKLLEILLELDKEADNNVPNESRKR